MTIKYSDQICQEARSALGKYRNMAHNDSVLKMALEGLIEIENGVLDDAAAEQAARHVSACNSCIQWLDEFFPERADQRKAREQNRKTYCCPAMQSAIKDQTAQTRFKFEMFRGEDSCWMINDDFCFARFCPWCGEALPNGAFEQSDEAISS